MSYSVQSTPQSETWSGTLLMHIKALLQAMRKADKKAIVSTMFQLKSNVINYKPPRNCGLFYDAKCTKAMRIS